MVVELMLMCLDFNYKKKKNTMALSEKNSNEEPTTGVAAIHIVLAMKTDLPTLAYRISMKPPHTNETR